MGCVLTRYTRVTGFFTPTFTWNPGKSEELKERKVYDLNKVK